ncbi:MAG: aldehyde ferredoxin oxidoreductase [Marinilabiliales bacterium]|nr:MAG: aldehyde ferredoxin oxidoreductase [Marinilabiliales bacterium]
MTEKTQEEKEPRKVLDSHIKALVVDSSSAMYKTVRYPVGEYFGPVDLGLYHSTVYNSLNIGTGLMAGSIFPGSNRLIFTGFSPTWTGFYISSMGGAGLVFDNLGIDMLSISGKAPEPSILILNRVHGEEIQIRVEPCDIKTIWKEGRMGVYSLMDYVAEQYRDEYLDEFRILATGPAAASTDCAGIVSVPVRKGELTYVDTWAGRGGFGSKMVQEHGIVAVIYGGTFLDVDFRDRSVADKWFEDRYQKKLAAKDLESTTKYRFDPKVDTGGTFGVNFATMGGRVMAFNYDTMHWSEDERLELHDTFIKKHYLKQFNEETIKKKQNWTCGEPCVAVCKKMNNEFKKDYEPYQTMGPLIGVFDQRAAEIINHHADTLGFDAISIGGVLAWLMDLLYKGLITKEELGVTQFPIFRREGFSVETDSMHNARLGIEILDAIVERKGILDFSQGARRWGRKLARHRGRAVLDAFLYTSFGRRGYMVPNQYWTPGVLSPMPIMGKYYMYYGNDFVHPRELGHLNAERFQQELILDNTGICRFHRNWAEEMMPEVIGELWGNEIKEKFIKSLSQIAYNINSRNNSSLWESYKNVELIETFLIRKHEVEGNNHPDLLGWIDYFKRDRRTAAIDYWYEVHKGIGEALNEF